MNEKNHPEDYTFRFTIRETIGLILAFCGDHEVTDAEQLLLDAASDAVRLQLIEQNFHESLGDQVWWDQHSPNPPASRQPR
jgi:hypothetical protein